jgi:hypothetical protein
MALSPFGMVCTCRFNVSGALHTLHSECQVGFFLEPLNHNAEKYSYTLLIVYAYSCRSLDSNAYLRILPNYCATYLPIAIVMIANPLLYASSSKDVTLQAARALGQFTSRYLQNS